ncbi:MAG: Insertion element protein [Deltaproteobacteria bacterium]
MEIRCPDCGSDTFYRYGKTGRGKQRYLCMSCGRQYSGSAEPKLLPGSRLVCPLCGHIMYVYRREKTCIRFRCSKYPMCKTYKKIIYMERTS